MGNQFHSPKRGQSPPPIFGPFLLSRNGWMPQDATWYGGRPQPRRLCVGWGPSYPQKKRAHAPTQFLAHAYCGQPAGWMKTPLGTEVEFGPGHVVLDGDPASAAKKAQQRSSPFFSAHVYCGHDRPSQPLLSSCCQVLCAKRSVRPRAKAF